LSLDQELPRPTWERRLGAALTTIAFLIYPLLLWRGWGRWNDVLVDFGRELYVPWRLAEGDLLYRDIAYFNGPLSPYWNAMWFSVTGPSLMTMTIVNAVITGLFAVLLHRVISKVSGSIAAGASLLFFFPVFACGHFPGIANYNFLSPYSHEMTHGLFLGLAAMRMGLTGRLEGQWARALFCGFLLGLCFLTKAEVFIASLGAIGWMFMLAMGTESNGYWKRVGLVLGGFIAAPLIAFGLLSTKLSGTEAMLGVLGSWTGIFGSNAAQGMFYGTISGVDALGDNLKAMGANFGWLLMLFLPAALMDMALVKKNTQVQWACGLLYAAGIGALFYSNHWTPQEWMLSARSMPLIALIAVIVAARLAWKRPGPTGRRWAARSSFAMFSLLMLLKVLFIVIFPHYGFALAVCAAALMFSVLMEWLPGSAILAKSQSAVLRCAVMGWIIATSVGFWSMSEASFAEKNVLVGKGADAFWSAANQGADIRGEGVRQLLEKIEALTAPSQTVLVLPEGIMVNYLARRKTPTRHINFMPPELDLFGERNIVQDLRDAPAPAACALIHKNTIEYGFPYFGTDYGQSIMNWVRRRYRPDWQFAQPPLDPRTGFGFGIGFLGPR
jgi:hypothetical protein